MTKSENNREFDRRGFLQCMAWVGTGAMWTLASGVLKGMPIEHAAHGAAHSVAGTSGLRFVQISDSHIGFDKPANADVVGTLRTAVAKIKAASERPSFVLHTGDLTHLSKPEEFDTLQQVMQELALPVFYVPGEHDVLNDDGKSYLARFGGNTRGAGWQSFNEGGVHFIGLVNVLNLKAGGLGLNLTAAEYVFLLDPWWNPAVEAQAIDRAHRIGQSRHVFAYRLIARDTVEERVLELQQRKRHLADAILTADNSLIRDLKREDLELLLS